MKHTLISHYTNTELVAKDSIGEINRIVFTFHDGPKVEILGNQQAEYMVSFIDIDSGKNLYGCTIKNNMWCASTIKYLVNWRLIVQLGNEIVATEEFMLNNTKSVKIILDTQSLGDLLAFIGPISEFQKKHGCELTCVLFNRHIKSLIEKNYTNIKFIDVDDSDLLYYATYKLGYFTNWTGLLKTDPRTLSLTEIAGNVLNTSKMEIKPEFVVNKNAAAEYKKYVCIGTQSTTQAKYWNNPIGWSEVIEYVKSLGYDVWCIDLHSHFGSGDTNMNHIPAGAIDKTGPTSLDVRADQLAGAEFFIGLGSGLSWLAWAVNTPVIMISGFSKNFSEFFTPYRVANKSVCNGCWNDVSVSFDKNDWNWCPRKKNFECTKQIASTDVICQIDRLLSDTVLKNFNWGIQSTRQKYILYSELLEPPVNIYEWVLPVDHGDVVVDIGAHVGTFSYAISRDPARCPAHIIAIEPSSLRLPYLRNNLSGISSTILNVGISDQSGILKNGLEFDGYVEDFNKLSFSDFITDHITSQIDFLKLDCEGGEYDIFTEKNLPWIKTNVKKISGEWHLSSPILKDKFRIFRDVIIKEFKTYHVYSIDGVNIKWDLFNEHFLEYYTEVYIFIDNRDMFTV